MNLLVAGYECIQTKRLRGIDLIISIRKRTVGQSISAIKDLSRRLASAKLLGGAEPGAIEALERLLNAILLKFETAEPGEGDPL